MSHSTGGKSIIYEGVMETRLSPGTKVVMMLQLKCDLEPCSVLEAQNRALPHTGCVNYLGLKCEYENKENNTVVKG